MKIISQKQYDANPDKYERTNETRVQGGRTYHVLREKISGAGRFGKLTKAGFLKIFSTEEKRAENWNEFASKRKLVLLAKAPERYEDYNEPEHFKECLPGRLTNSQLKEINSLTEEEAADVNEILDRVLADSLQQKAIKENKDAPNTFDSTNYQGGVWEANFNITFADKQEIHYGASLNMPKLRAETFGNLVRSYLEEKLGHDSKFEVHSYPANESTTRLSVTVYNPNL